MLFSCVYPFTEVLSEIRRKVTRKSFRCASELSARGLPCGKRVRRSSWGRRPTDLARRDTAKLAGTLSTQFFGGKTLAFRPLHSNDKVIYDIKSTVNS